MLNIDVQAPTLSPQKKREDPWRRPGAERQNQELLNRLQEAKRKRKMAPGGQRLKEWAAAQRQRKEQKLRQGQREEQEQEHREGQGQGQRQGQERLVSGWHERQLERARCWRERLVNAKTLGLAHLKRLLQGLRSIDLAWLLRYDTLLHNVYVLDWVDHRWLADHPCDGDLPWPLILLVASHSKKHIFWSGSVERMRAAQQSSCLL